MAAISLSRWPSLSPSSSRCTACARCASSSARRQNRRSSMLRRHPLLLAEWLAARNLLQRARAHTAAILAVGLGALGALAVILLSLAPRFATMFDGLLTYRVLVVVLIAIYAAFTVGGQRQKAEVRYTQFWLAAAPVHQYSRTLAILVVTLMPLAAQLFAVFVLFAAMGIAGSVEAR